MVFSNVRHRVGRPVALIAAAQSCCRVCSRCRRPRRSSSATRTARPKSATCAQLQRSSGRSCSSSCRPHWSWASCSPLRRRSSATIPRRSQPAPAACSPRTRRRDRGDVRHPVHRHPDRRITERRRHARARQCRDWRWCCSWPRRGLSARRRGVSAAAVAAVGVAAILVGIVGPGRDRRPERGPGSRGGRH